MVKNLQFLFKTYIVSGGHLITRLTTLEFKFNSVHITLQYSHFGQVDWITR